MGQGLPKQYRQMGEGSVLECALRPFLETPDLAGIVVVLAPDDQHWPQCRYAQHPKVVTAVGGDSRAESVLAGLQALADAAQAHDWVLVHDAARPLLAVADLARLRVELAGHAVGGLLGTPVADTLKRVDAAGCVVKSMPREGLWRAFTPQMFRYKLLRDALASALTRRLPITDESSALEAAGHAPQIVASSPANLKLTRVEDWQLARRLMGDSSMRVGHGYDAHRLVAGRRLVLGGVEIPHNLGLEAHSDGDVALHALCDALLGAAALGDIGQHFSDRDPQFAGIDSRVLLRQVVTLIEQQGLRVVNIDLTIIAQTPRLAPYMTAMGARIAEDLQVTAMQVNVKATTTEGMGFTGRQEGIAAHAVALLVKRY
jgi:2-C-methyl-D-erythritol 2,4-cyclodiphosphate synthase/2-C-methyl-D-erythritol 4-phosphate cytidylyltransferase